MLTGRLPTVEVGVTSLDAQAYGINAGNPDCSENLNNLIASAKSSGTDTRIILPRGFLKFGGTLNMTNSIGLTIEGQGQYGTSGSSLDQYRFGTCMAWSGAVGASTGPFLDLASSVNCCFKGFSVWGNDDALTGTSNIVDVLFNVDPSTIGAGSGLHLFFDMEFRYAEQAVRCADNQADTNCSDLQWVHCSVNNCTTFLHVLNDQGVSYQLDKVHMNNVTNCFVLDGGGKLYYNGGNISNTTNFIVGGRHGVNNRTINIHSVHFEQGRTKWYSNSLGGIRKASLNFVGCAMNSGSTATDTIIDLVGGQLCTLHGCSLHLDGYALFNLSGNSSVNRASLIVEGCTLEDVTTDPATDSIEATPVNHAYKFRSNTDSGGVPFADQQFGFT